MLFNAIFSQLPEENQEPNIKEGQTLQWSNERELTDEY
jgi:hypothetical protein